MASEQPESSWIVYAWSNFLHPIRFFSSKEGQDHIVKNWSRSNLDGRVRFWASTSCPEASQCARLIRPGLAECNRPSTNFQFQTLLRSATDGPDHIVQNQPGSDWVLADYVRFWPDGIGPEASQWAKIIWPASGQCFWANLDQTQIGSGMLTDEASQCDVWFLWLVGEFGQCNVCFLTWHCKLVHGYMEDTELVPRRQQFHAAPALRQPNSTVNSPLRWMLKIAL